MYKRLPEVDLYAADLTGKTVIITGANAGLGFEAAKHLARMSPGKLILACRNIQSAEEAKALIVKDSKCPTIECWKLDLLSFASVKDFVGQFEKEGGGKLDLLIQNAGINNHGPYKTSADGWEAQLQVNHLSPALLGFLLLPYMAKSAPSPPTPRITLVASEMHYYVEIEEREGNLLEALSKEGTFEDMIRMVYSFYPKNEARYPMTKLLNVMFARSFGSRIPGTSGLTVNSVNPGPCASSLQRDLDHKMAVRLAQKWFFRTTEMGSRTIVHAAVSKEAQGKQGAYWNNCEQEDVIDWLLTEQGGKVQERIWNETIDVLSKVDDRVPGIIREYLP
ncbi:NAD(P)-binding protein [Calocera viscosa TUFC12733]|uniref:NAD(P)-binding protein n=1 Tax=Calocera viscosa (strain TUFC12733) TaxID=1330018 RepID=A0A167PSQ4_CALVF|nr:NAD(P)-binding protein [Calocera viscosa TUFC12733]